jgi:antitoxin (DNA-binding transcriptional repressor) of toxin-antitoxin stability system
MVRGRLPRQSRSQGSCRLNPCIVALDDCAIVRRHEWKSVIASFNIRGLRERTGEVVRNAEPGKLAVVAKHGHRLFVAVPLDEALLRSGVGVALAVELFEDGTISLGKAAKRSGLSYEGTVLVPDVVAQECLANSLTPRARAIEAALRSGRLSRVPDPEASERAFAVLDAGESAAIGLALQRQAAVLIDEKLGRRVAVHLGLP